MSDTSQGPGWWQASDQKWYAPELHPNYVPPVSGSSNTSDSAGPKTGPFVILNVVPEGTPPSALHPGPGTAPDTVLLEPDDGSDLRAVIGTTLCVSRPQGPGRSPQPIIKVSKVQASVLISDCRVAIACSNYDKGGSWYPGLGGIPAGVIALTATAVSSARARKRREGNMMVGQVRYPWLVSVGFCEKPLNAVRLGMMLPPLVTSLLFLDIVMPGVSTAEVARDVARRAARYNLAEIKAELPEQDRRRLEELAQGPSLAPQPSGFTSYFLYDIPTST